MYRVKFCDDAGRWHVYGVYSSGVAAVSLVKLLDSAGFRTFVEVDKGTPPLSSALVR